MIALSNNQSGRTDVVCAFETGGKNEKELREEPVMGIIDYICNLITGTLIPKGNQIILYSI